MLELFAKAEEKTPYVLVALQECERMNTLTREMKRSLKEVDLGLKVLVCGSCMCDRQGGLHHRGCRRSRRMGVVSTNFCPSPPNCALDMVRYRIVYSLEDDVATLFRDLLHTKS